MLWAKISVVTALLIIAACTRQGTPAPTVQAQQAQQEQQPAPVDTSEASAFTVEGWQRWERLSRAPFFSQGHSEMWVEVYVPAEHAAAYLDEDAPVPPDMVIVKPQYETETSQEPENLTVMILDESADSGWIWGIYDPSGRRAMELGQIEMCTQCHAAAGDDMLFRTLE
jgi:hypothetical protein